MGKSLNALQVFAMAIEYLVEDMMKTVNDRLTSSIKKDEVHWVLTVPAIWTDSAKQFMREAAVQVFLENLLFCTHTLHSFFLNKVSMS